MYFTRIENSGTGIKVLTPTQMPHRLPIVLAGIKIDNTLDCSVNKLRGFAYSLYKSK